LVSVAAPEAEVLVDAGPAVAVESMVDEEEESDVVDDEEVRDLLDWVPSVVGVLRVVMPCVYDTLTVGRVRTVAPLALFLTVAARSLAVPQPNWEKPPSKTFM
jgi:hypothetical protein